MSNQSKDSSGRYPTLTHKWSDQDSQVSATQSMAAASPHTIQMQTRESNLSQVVSRRLSTLLNDLSDNLGDIVGDRTRDPRRRGNFAGK